MAHLSALEPRYNTTLIGISGEPGNDALASIVLHIQRAEADGTRDESVAPNIAQAPLAPALAWRPPSPP